MSQAAPCPTPASLALGQLGCDWIDNTGAVTPATGKVWGVIVCHTDCTFTTLTCSDFRVNGTAVANLNSKTLVRGEMLHGTFTAITLASGSVFAYYKT